MFQNLFLLLKITVYLNNIYRYFVEELFFESTLCDSSSMTCFLQFIFLLFALHFIFTLAPYL